MPDTIDIPFTVTGQADLVKTLNESAAASKEAAAALEKQSKAAASATKSYRGMNREQKNVGAGENSAAAPASRSASGRKQRLVSERYVSGPNQRKPILEAQLKRAHAEKNDAAAADVGRAIVRNEKQLAGKNPPPFEKRLERAIRSTRFGSGGVQPLVGQTADLLGLGEGLAGKLGVAGAALGLFTETLKTAVDAGSKFGQLQAASGSDSKTTGALTTLGLSADQAASYNGAITSDPQAMAAAAQYGIANAPGMYGNQDWGKELIKQITALHNDPDQNRALRNARAMHLDGVYSQYKGLSDNAFNTKIGSDAAQLGGALNPKFDQQTAEFKNSMDRAGESFTKLSAIVMGPSINGLTKFSNEMTDLFSGRMSLKRFVTGAGEDKFGNIGTDKDDQTKATKDLTDALKDNTQAIGMGQRTYGGGGERTDKAIPRGGNIGSGWALRRNLQAGAMRLGAFG